MRSHHNSAYRDSWRSRVTTRPTEESVINAPVSHQWLLDLDSVVRKLSGAQLRLMSDAADGEMQRRVQLKKRT